MVAMGAGSEKHIKHTHEEQTGDKEMQFQHPGPEELEKQMEELSVDEDDLKSAGRSFNTFATNFTTCTIPAFEKYA